MNPPIQFKTIVLPFFIPLVLACFALSPVARAVLPPPPPDGGYPNGNTAEGNLALFNLTTGPDNTANGASALLSNTTGDGNTASGDGALANNTTGSENTATGSTALESNTTGVGNTANGASALLENTGDGNTASGDGALLNNTSGNSNTANSVSALFSNTTGNSNIALGEGAGFNLTTGDNNIDIGNQGIAAEANTIRIGAQGTRTKTFIAGISGTVLGPGVAVRVNANGQLGAPSSSARFKQNIKPMDKASEAILALKPVPFRYKKELDPEGIPQFGLVAEDVEKVNPDLVVRDQEGKPYSVTYDQVNAMLLNEFLKEHRKMEEQGATITQLKKDFRATMAQLTARLDEQAAQIQKVSAQLEASKSAPRVAENNQ